MQSLGTILTVVALFMAVLGLSGAFAAWIAVLLRTAPVLLITSATLFGAVLAAHTF